MKEARFLKINQEKWKKIEEALRGKDRDPEALSAYFIEVTDDLAYIKTYFPESSVEKYLNALAGSLYEIIYKRTWNESGYIKRFFTEELPLVFFRARKEIILAFLLLMVAVTIGALSTFNDNYFVRLILGDKYVAMTLENIEKGDPMAVYKSMNQSEMFLGITLNNLRVSFLAFAGGLIFSFGSIYVLFVNGVMIGTFFSFLYQENVFGEAMLIVWLHGTIEIASITVAGAAGFVIGKGLLFPGTYSRVTSFVANAKNGAQMILGIAPLIITAGIIESFITRYTGMHWSVKLLIILSSLCFSVFYFYLYPSKVALRKYE
ncbi:MAG: stage II sporulation protein M [Ignavibacteriaceae bacterium]|nr:stage II sporulation protein M [Ignavibacteriaceae bacterium]